MYVYCPFSSHNGITIRNVLILFFSPVKAKLFYFFLFSFLGIVTNLLLLYRLSYFLFCSLIFVYFYVLVLTL